jgi:broad specificity phosphatase PhoE
LIFEVIYGHFCKGMTTFLYLVRHGATAANLAMPPRLQGRRTDPPLVMDGVRQAEATRDLLANVRLDACYSSPLKRAAQTAEIIAAPHRLSPIFCPELTECDVGEWEGQSWDNIATEDADRYRTFMADPALVPYPGGESFTDVHARSASVVDRLARDHAGQSVLVVSHHVVLRTYLAVALGLPIRLARRVNLDNCGVSVVTWENGQAAVMTLNTAFHVCRNLRNSPA